MSAPDNATPPAPSLAEEFEALATRATPGPWLVRYEGSGYPEPSPPEYYLTDGAGAPLYSNIDFYPGDGNNVEFTAFCGTHREAILAALRAAESDTIDRSMCINPSVQGFSIIKPRE